MRRAIRARYEAPCLYPIIKQRARGDRSRAKSSYNRANRKRLLKFSISQGERARETTRNYGDNDKNVISARSARVRSWLAWPYVAPRRAAAAGAADIARRTTEFSYERVESKSGMYRSRRRPFAQQEGGKFLKCEFFELKRKEVDVLNWSKNPLLKKKKVKHPESGTSPYTYDWR